MATDAAGELIDRVIAYARAQGGADVDQAETFLRQYYDQTTPEDLGDRKVADLYGEAMAHRDLGGRRDPGTPQIRVYLPTADESGWGCAHTAVDIVTDDMPFLVDSVTNELNRHGLRVHLVVHPIISVRRDADGRLLEVLGPEAVDERAVVESFLHIEVDRQRQPDLEPLRDDIADVLGDVARAVDDWGPMRDRALALADAFVDEHCPAKPEENAEAVELLRWMANDHFTFLGCREYELVAAEPVNHQVDHLLRAIPGTGLGILRDHTERSSQFAQLASVVREQVCEPVPLMLTKADSRSTVHRRVHLDYIGVKRFSSEGEVIGERRFLGLFESRAYDSSVFEIPVIRRRVRVVMERADLPPDGHSDKRLRHILETYPRDELFQISEDDLFDTAMGILRLQQRQRVRLFVRRDLFERFVSCLVYVPRDHYTTAVRQRMATILAESFGGSSVDFSAHLTESALTPVHFVVHTDPGSIPDVDTDEVEARLVEAARSWSDDLYNALVDACGEADGIDLYRTFGEALPAAYREDFGYQTAVADVLRLASLGEAKELTMSLYRPADAPPTVLRLKIYRAGERISLSRVLPLLEDLGVRVVDERPYGVNPADHQPHWIYDFGLQVGESATREIDNNRDLLLDVLRAVWRGSTESDGFNRLVLEAGLPWRSVSVLRAYRKYLRQIGTTFSQSYIEQCLSAHPDLVRLLMAIFDARFNPDRPGDRSSDLAMLDQQIDGALDDIPSLDEDRILRSFRQLVQATLRTNFYQVGADGQPHSYLALKLDPSAIPGVPLPRPMFEIFVYSPTVEGVHLRDRKVARGGIRWSDRREDFRTEILDLMKAQKVKNSVIVPGGAKGGFILKSSTAGLQRDAAMQLTVDAYRTFITALLDVTDDLVDGKIVPPDRVIRYDDDDPYLVVAADKGTATFSDLANEIAVDRGFWLGDAFASGGSWGYDHKRLGITARGAWESVKRHFRQLGIDEATTDFTVAGIGDMSGDVFGNGMLLSHHIKLVAAFDHRHIFLDPDPDPAASFAERQRLFGLARSSWDDFDRSVLSTGGGIFPRTAKSISLSPEMKRRLDVDVDALAPDEVIKAVLRSPVDLLWNGGIGTYVKATSETHADVGDKSNDSVRVNASELRCRVVGEGGNLGITQQARIEYALAGGRIFADSIDNSAGVDCSDHEVNIKILLGSIVAAGELTAQARDELLASMADDVAHDVLEDNYGNAQALSIARSQAGSMLGAHGRYIAELEARGHLSRAAAVLPTEEDLAERPGASQGLTTPELAVLLAHTKILLSDAVLDSDLPEDPFLDPLLASYFPAPLRERYRQQIQAHTLRREILATAISNQVVNRGGTSLLYRLADETQATQAEIARAHLEAAAMFDLDGVWSEIEALDGRVDVETQTSMLLSGRRLVERATRWLLRNRSDHTDMTAEVERYRNGIAALAEGLSDVLIGDDLEQHLARIDGLVGHGVPPALAARVAGLESIFPALDIIDVSNETQRPMLPVAAVYFALGEELHLDWLRDQIATLPRDDRWRTQARASLRADLFSHHRQLVSDAVVTHGVTDLGDADLLVSRWMKANRRPLERFQLVLAGAEADDNLDLAVLSVAVRAVHDLAHR